MTKILCPDGVERDVEDVLTQDFEHYPPVVLKALLAGRNKSKKKREGNPRFGVTRLTGPCIRRSYYDLVEEIPLPLEKLWIFSRGHAIHNFFQDHLEEHENEVFLKKDFGLFSAIGFVDVLSDNIMYEFKTIERIPNEPKEEHVKQLQSYFSMIDPLRQSQIKALKIVYFSLKEVKVYEIEKRDMINYLEARGTTLAYSLKTESPPERQESFACNYCEFKDICFNRDKDFP